MKNFKRFLIPAIFFLPFSALAQDCSEFNKIKSMMESGFSTMKANKPAEATTDYGMMLITKKVWGTAYRYPDAISADITEVLKVAPDPKNAGHNVFISFNFAKNSTRAVAEAAFTKIRDNIKSCTPAGWKVQERSGTTYSRYYMMDGNYYDESPHKITLQLSKLEGPGDKYTTDLIFDSVVK